MKVSPFLVLVWLHYLGDYPLQGAFLANSKANDDYSLFVHCMIWTGTVSAGLVYLGLFEYWKAVMLLVGHFLIDRWKARKVDRTSSLKRDLWVDQVLHIVQIGICLIQ